MPFYPDVKAHLSPSALAAWIGNRSLFIRSYFKGEKTPQTAAMKAGTQAHRLIEAGLLKVKHSYEMNEVDVRIEVASGRIVYGIPDSRDHLPKNGLAKFVDYKTGKENEWEEKLPTDIKMKATAWLVWQATGKPKTVRGYVEYIATEWDSVAKEVVPIEGKDTVVNGFVYSSDSLQAFTQVILKAFDDIDEAYEKWKQSTDEFINKADVEKYAEVRAKIAVLETEAKEIGDRILAQMDFGGTLTSSMPGFGTFYITERKTYEYPKGFSFTVGRKAWTLEEAVEIEMAAKAARKNYEVTVEPKSVSRSLGFRVPKEK